MPQKVKIESYECKVELVRLRTGKGLETEVDRKYCPYKSIQDFVDLREDYKNINEPFFIFRDYRPVNPCKVRAVLKKCLRAIGLNPDMYGTHIFILDELQT